MSVVLDPLHGKGQQDAPEWMPGKGEEPGALARRRPGTNHLGVLPVLTPIHVKDPLTHTAPGAQDRRQALLMMSLLLYTFLDKYIP